MANISCYNIRDWDKNAGSLCLSADHKNKTLIWNDVRSLGDNYDQFKLVYYRDEIEGKLPEIEPILHSIYDAEKQLLEDKEVKEYNNNFAIKVCLVDTIERIYKIIDSYLSGRDIGMIIVESKDVGVVNKIRSKYPAIAIMMISRDVIDAEVQKSVSLYNLILSNIEILKHDIVKCVKTHITQIWKKDKEIIELRANYITGHGYYFILNNGYSEKAYFIEIKGEADYIDNIINLVNDKIACNDYNKTLLQDGLLSKKWRSFLGDDLYDEIRKVSELKESKSTCIVSYSERFIPLGLCTTQNIGTRPIMHILGTNCPITHKYPTLNKPQDYRMANRLNGCRILIINFALDSADEGLKKSVRDQNQAILDLEKICNEVKVDVCSNEIKLNKEDYKAEINERLKIFPNIIHICGHYDKNGFNNINDYISDAEICDLFSGYAPNLVFLSGCQTARKDLPKMLIKDGVESVVGTIFDLEGGDSSFEVVSGFYKLIFDKNKKRNVSEALLGAKKGYGMDKNKDKKELFKVHNWNLFGNPFLKME